MSVICSWQVKLGQVQEPPQTYTRGGRKRSVSEDLTLNNTPTKSPGATEEAQCHKVEFIPDLSSITGSALLPRSHTFSSIRNAGESQIPGVQPPQEGASGPRPCSQQHDHAGLSE